jgi:sensor histidine kinase YesM
MLVLINQYKLELLQSALDSIFYNLSFAIIGLSLWYVVRFAKSSKPGVFYLIVNHITTATVLILLWISAIRNILESIFSESLQYLAFSNTAIIWRVSIGLLMYIILVLIYFAEQYYTDLQEKVLNENVLKSVAKEAELKMLKAQINPHFLFNSLNSISSLALTDSQKAHEMIISLSDYFRYSISKSENQYSTLKAELENCKRYLEIEQIRFGSKLKINFDIDNNILEYSLPAMILQPLYENAVKYGVYESIGQVYIYTLVKGNTDYFEIIIENNMEESAKGIKGEGVGLKNVKERLRLSYNTDNLLSAKHETGKFIISLKIPFKN